MHTHGNPEVRLSEMLTHTSRHPYVRFLETLTYAPKIPNVHTVIMALTRSICSSAHNLFVAHGPTTFRPHTFQKTSYLIKTLWIRVQVVTEAELVRGLAELRS